MAGDRVASGLTDEPPATETLLSPTASQTTPAVSGAMESAARRSAASQGARKTFLERVEAFISRLGSRNNFWHRLTSLIWLPYAFRSGIRMKRVDASTFTATLPFTRFNKNWYNAMAGAALLGNSEIAGGMYVFGVCGGDYIVVCKHLEYRFLRPCFGPAEYRCTPREDLRRLVGEGGEFNVTLDMDVVQIIPTMVGKKVGRAVRRGRSRSRRARAEASARGHGAPVDSGAQVDPLAPVDLGVRAGSVTPERPQRADRAERLERLKNREKRVGRVVVTFHVTPKSHHKARAARRSTTDPATDQDAPPNPQGVPGPDGERA